MASNGNMKINKAHTREYILRRAKEIRPGWDMRNISDIIYQDLNALVERHIDGSLRRHSSGGKTFKTLQ